MVGVGLSKVRVLGAMAAAICLIAAPSALAATAGSFSAAPGSPIVVGSTPSSIAVADFNGDGDPDLAVTNRDSGTVSILLGAAGAGFESQPPITLAANGRATGIAAGDFNQDGDPDLVVAEPGANLVAILTGAPGATFNVATVPVVQAPVRIATGDFNGDNDPDLAVVTTQNMRMAILRGGVGTGFATLSTNTSSGDSASAIVSADFNADGKADLATAQSLLGGLRILTGNGAAGFTPSSDPTAGQNSSDLATADFNGDGDPDLAVTNFGSNDLSVLLGQGGAAFGAATQFALGSGPSAVAVGDFNGDGKADLAATNQAQGAPAGSASILLGNGAGSFAAGPGSPLQTGAEPLDVATGDFNGDGAADLVTADGGADTVSVFTNDEGSDGKAPETRIDKGPSKKTSKRKAKISYSANEPATFECRLKGKGVAKDLRSFTECGAAKEKYKHLKPGKKKFQVRAVDAAGNVDPTPAKLKWKITG